ncbi:MAG: hypothetical protein J5950_09075, partial [Clostridia bacterium]|nr:hypothetical protein [Clostridia bacterium]
MRSRKFFLTLAVLLMLLVATLCTLQFTQFGYLMTVPYRSAFNEVADHIYINKNYAGDNQEVLVMIEQAEDRVRAFFGGLYYRDETIFIICDDAKLLRRLGEDHGTVSVSFPFERHYICMSDEYLELDIVSHEITHVELRARLSSGAQKMIPTWFDEGLALQNDYRERYGEEQWIEQTENGGNTVALDDMDTPEEFYAGEA